MIEINVHALYAIYGVLTQPRTITGKERDSKEWCLPAKNGEAYYYDSVRQEWILVTEETQLPENAFVMGLADVYKRQ